jgi:hypothetical protein
MKKTIILIAALAALFPAVQAKGISLALSASYFAPADGGFKEIYGSGGVLPGLRLEVGVVRCLSLYASYGYFSKKGTTPVLAEEAKSTQHHAALGASWNRGISTNLGLGLWGGLLYVSYKEEALGMQASGSAVGFEAGGHLRVSLGKKLFASPFISYGLARDTVEEVDLKLGGLRAGVGLGIFF